MSFGSKKIDHTGFKKKSGFSSETKVALLIFSLVGVVLASLVFWYVTASKKLVALDETTLCPLDGPYGTTVVILDLSDALSYLQEQKLRNFFSSKQSSGFGDGLSVQKHERLKVYLLDENAAKNLPTPIVDICNPGDGEGLSELTSSPALVKKRYVQAYEKPLESALLEIMQSSSTKTSPLVEAIRGIALTSFGSEASEGHVNNLLLISDMLQHTDSISHYRGDQNLMPQALSKFRADLDTVDEVHIRMFEREQSRQLQGKSLLTFWNNYLKISGTSLTSAERWVE